VSKATSVRTGASSLRAIPWTLLAQVAVVFARRLGALSSRDRRQLSGLLRKSRGRPGNLTSREREELMGIVRRLDLVSLGRELPWRSARTRRSRR
jgi:hypothetical protein